MNEKILYTLDRVGTLSSGAHIQLQDAIYHNNKLQEHQTERFWQQVSRHGNNYFFNPHINLTNAPEKLSIFIEMLLEERRKACFPNKPSRFQSLFACTTIRDAAWFRGSSRSPLSTPIYEVLTTTNCHKADMNLLNVNCSPIEFSHRMELYWKGETKELYQGYEPFWEVLVPLPAMIGNRVQE
ncbi:hypothetical protein DQ010_25615 [Salmonella enterica subsp. enterica serovar Oranienburg]|uniref:hypothetical protein n=1 Tax=Salmonella enterica TaxID=28901 RepID=UPI0012C75CB9|nr:hypothetical protein [Salmonella enterica subsp. enterica serovar Oranienburg]